MLIVVAALVGNRALLPTAKPEKSSASR